MQSEVIFMDGFLSRTFSWKSYHYCKETFSCRWRSFRSMMPYCLTAMNDLLKTLNRLILQHLSSEEIFSIVWHHHSWKNDWFISWRKWCRMIVEKKCCCEWWVSSTSQANFMKSYADTVDVLGSDIKWCFSVAEGFMKVIASLKRKLLFWIRKLIKYVEVLLVSHE